MRVNQLVPYRTTVASGDGVLYEVTYVSPDGLVDLRPLEHHGESITLPASELRRATRPARRKPPIEGMPEERPVCAFCAQALRPIVNEQRAFGKPNAPPERRTWVRWNSYSGLFCTLKCAHRFAVAAHRAGYRIARAT